VNSLTDGSAKSCPSLAAVFQQRVTRLDQFVEFFLLLGHAPGGPFFILRTGRPRSLFDQLPDIVPKYRDAVVEFG
jgi:hypothetical protein